MRKLYAILAALALAGCATLAPAQEPTDLTGSWFDADNPGHGFVIDDAPEAFVAYWYNFETGFGDFTRDAQAWFVGTAEDSTGVVELYRPSGTWNAAQVDNGEPVGTLAFGTLDNGDLIVDYEFFDFNVCQPVMVSPVYSGCAGTVEVTRLTRRDADG